MKFLTTALLVCLSGACYAQSAGAADREFVAMVSQGGAFEVAAGRLAMAKGATQDIRDFGNTEVHDHKLVGAKLKRISAHSGIAISPALDAEFKEKLHHLSTLSGPAFDQAYLAEIGTLHDKDGAAFAKEGAAGGSKSFRDFGLETHRIVERHIGQIKALPAADKV